MTTTATETAEPLRRQLADHLRDTGALVSDMWHSAFAEVPREEFVPQFTYRKADGSQSSCQAGDDGYLEAVYQDASLITQTDAQGTATSSSSQPSLMARMLEVLQVTSGMSVLEVGAGTGYNAALLAHALGDAAVVSVDIDPELVAGARQALEAAGYRPAVVCGNGAHGHPERAPYDRLIATFGVPRLPGAWLDQVRPGGVMVVNVGLGLARLHAGEDGGAAGRFLDYSAFMPIRSETGSVAATAGDVLQETSGGGDRHETWWPHGLEARPVVALRSLTMPGVREVTLHLDDGDEYVFLDRASGSWARARRRGDGQAVVVESGPRRLWGELVAVVDLWTSHGRPELTSYELAVTPDGRHTLTVAGSEGEDWLLP